MNKITCKNSSNNTSECINTFNNLEYFDTDFERVPNSGNKILYTSTDPRLVSSAHNGQRILLDSIPLNGKVQVWETDKIKSYDSVYNSYKDIKGGSNTYYYDKYLAVPFIPQLFSERSIQKHDYIDPMDSFKPHYTYCTTTDGKHSLTWLRDSTFHREDLMSKQIWNRNQTNYEVNYLQK